MMKNGAIVAPLCAGFAALPPALEGLTPAGTIALGSVQGRIDLRE